MENVWVIGHIGNSIILVLLGLLMDLVSGPTGQKPTRSELGPAHLAEIGSKFIFRGINFR